MKNKKMKNFKILPFCISVLMVLLITGGIGVYTSVSYVDTKRTFVEDFFAKENAPKETKDYINNAASLSSLKYNDASSLLNLTYRDPKTNKVYTDQPTNGIYFKDGVLHYKDFSVYLIAEITETKVNDKTIKTIEYTFNFFNVDYNKIGLDTLKDISNCPLRVVYVNGTSLVEDRENDVTDGEGLDGEGALEYTLENESSSGYEAIGQLFYSYSYKVSGEDRFIEADIMDRNAKDANGTAITPILKCTLGSYGNATYGKGDGLLEFDSEIEDTATFAIIKVDNSEEGYTVLLEGTMENILHSDDLNEETERNFHKGYSNTLHAHPDYLKYTWKTITLFTGIAFVISSVLAVLFYMIWIDDKQKPKAKK